MMAPRLAPTGARIAAASCGPSVIGSGQLWRWPGRPCRHLCTRATAGCRLRAGDCGPNGPRPRSLQGQCPAGWSATILASAARRGGGSAGRAAGAHRRRREAAGWRVRGVRSGAAGAGRTIPAVPGGARTGTGMRSGRVRRPAAGERVPGDGGPDLVQHCLVSGGQPPAGQMPGHSPGGPGCGAGRADRCHDGCPEPLI